jgi:hypothetical protein
MIAGRAVRVVLAAFAIGAVGVLTLIGFVGPTIASLDEWRAGRPAPDGLIGNRSRS